MPDATLALMTELTVKATTGLTGPAMTHEEAWAEVVRAMRSCLAWAMVRWARLEETRIELIHELWGKVERRLNDALRGVAEDELGVNLGDSLSP
jgi:hypothetical protein